MRTNEHDANLSLQPMVHKDWERVMSHPSTNPQPAPKTRPWLDLLRAALCIVLFALVGVMLGLGV